MIAVYTGMGAAVFCGAIGQLLMKSGLQGLPFADYSAMVNSLLYHHQSALLIIAGIFSYVVSIIVWVHTLKTYEVSKATSVLSLGYAIVYLGAAYWPGLAEPVTMQKSLGVALVMLGIWITQSSGHTEDI